MTSITPLPRNFHPLVYSGAIKPISDVNWFHRMILMIGSRRLLIWYRNLKDED